MKSYTACAPFFLIRQCCLVDRALPWNSGDLESIPSSATGLLGDSGQVISQALCASVSLYGKWGNDTDLFYKCFEIYGWKNVLCKSCVVVLNVFVWNIRGSGYLSCRYLGALRSCGEHLGFLLVNN